MIEIPLPPKGLSPNARLHWRVKARAVAAYREQCALLFRAAKGPGWAVPKRVEIEVEYRVHRGVVGAYHPKDEDNCRGSLKALCDGMKDAGVIASDAKRRVQWGRFTMLTTKRECKGRAGVMVTVKALA